MVLLAISSPSDEVNYCSQLATMRNRTTGELIFHTLLPGYQCTQCSNLTTGETCPHVYAVLPEHRSVKNLDIAISMLGSDKVTIDQELFGKVKSATSYMFREYVEKFSKQPLYRFREKVQVCHTFIDPCGGSTKSDFAMSTHASEYRQFILLGVSRFVNSANTMTDVSSIEKMFKSHFERIWQFPEYQEAYMFIYIELSDQLVTQVWANMIEALFPERKRFIHIFKGYEKKPGQPGVLTTESDKHIWTVGLQQLLDQNALHLAEKFISNEPETIKDVIMDQLTRYCREVEEADGPFGKTKVTYGGKRTGKDDVATAIAGSLRHHRERLCDPSYINWCRRMSIDRM